METNVVKVKLWGMNVGYLSWDKKAAAAVFEYEPSFLEEGLNIAPFTMSIDHLVVKKESHGWEIKTSYIKDFQR